MTDKKASATTTARTSNCKSCPVRFYFPALATFGAANPGWGGLAKNGRKQVLRCAQDDKTNLEDDKTNLDGKISNLDGRISQVAQFRFSNARAARG